MSAPSTRDRIIKDADRLIYQKGFEYMSIADIAAAAGISRGNLTFHFKTRDEILEAVIDLRLQHTRTILEKWESKGSTPAERIGSFINILIANRTKILLHGCPVGTLCTELAKLEHASLSHANEVFGLFRDWLGRHFAQLGCGAESKALAMRMLAWSQGIATLAQAFNDEKFIREEVRCRHEWLAGIGKKTPETRNADFSHQPKHTRSCSSSSSDSPPAKAARRSTWTHTKPGSNAALPTASSCSPAVLSRASAAASLPIRPRSPTSSSV